MDVAKVCKQQSDLTGRDVHLSWETMTPTQPPLQAMKYKLACSGSPDMQVFESVDGEGITLVQMLRTAQSMLDQHAHERCDFCDCWKGRMNWVTFGLVTNGLGNATGMDASSLSQTTADM